MQPQCKSCGKFIPYSRATLCGGFDNFPNPSWDEWWDGECSSCEAMRNVACLLERKGEGDG